MLNVLRYTPSSYFNQCELLIPSEMLDRISSIVASSLAVKQRYFAEHAHDVLQAAEIISSCFQRKGKLLVCGNGGSAADAQHIAGEFVNRFLAQERQALPALALTTDGSVLTCIANDTSFDQVFARQVVAFGAAGDVLLAISTSGNSPNVVQAVRTAKSVRMKIVGLLGRSGGQLAELCDVALVVPVNDTQRIQETHNLIAHIICEIVERTLFPESFKQSGETKAE